MTFVPALRVGSRRRRTRYALRVCSLGIACFDDPRLTRLGRSVVPTVRVGAPGGFAPAIISRGFLGYHSHRVAPIQKERRIALLAFLTLRLRAHQPSRLHVSPAEQKVATE